MPLPRLAALIAVATAALAVASCGDTAEKNDYVDQVNEVTSTLNEGLNKISTDAATIGSPDEAAAIFSDFGDQLDKAASDIEAIEPPGDVTDLHDQLVSEIQTLSSEATNASDEIKQGGPAAIAGVATGFITEANAQSTKIDSTITEINNELQD